MKVEIKFLSVPSNLLPQHDKDQENLLHPCHYTVSIINMWCVSCITCSEREAPPINSADRWNVQYYLRIMIANYISLFYEYYPIATFGGIIPLFTCLFRRSSRHWQCSTAFGRDLSQKILKLSVFVRFSRAAKARSGLSIHRKTDDNSSVIPLSRLEPWYLVDILAILFRISKHVARTRQVEGLAY